MIKTYIGPLAEAEVVVAGHPLGYVKKGEALFVPDDLASSVVWPEESWRDGAPEVEKPVAKPVATPAKEVK